MMDLHQLLIKPANPKTLLIAHSFETNRLTD